MNILSLKNKAMGYTYRAGIPNSSAGAFWDDGRPAA